MPQLASPSPGYLVLGPEAARQSWEGYPGSSGDLGGLTALDQVR